eukprot:767138-Hanusia_phi.AAC.4
MKEAFSCRQGWTDVCAFTNQAQRAIQEEYGEKMRNGLKHFWTLVDEGKIPKPDLRRTAEEMEEAAEAEMKQEAIRKFEELQEEEFAYEQAENMEIPKEHLQQLMQLGYNGSTALQVLEWVRKLQEQNIDFNAFAVPEVWRNSWKGAKTLIANDSSQKGLHKEAIKLSKSERNSESCIEGIVYHFPPCKHVKKASPIVGENFDWLRCLASEDLEEFDDKELNSAMFCLDYVARSFFSHPPPQLLDGMDFKYSLGQQGQSKQEHREAQDSQAFHSSQALKALFRYMYTCSRNKHALQSGSFDPKFPVGRLKNPEHGDLFEMLLENCDEAAIEFVADDRCTAKLQEALQDRVAFDNFCIWMASKDPEDADVVRTAALGVAHMIHPDQIKAALRLHESCELQ